MYQMAVVHSKSPKNITTFSIPRPSKIYPNWYFWFENIPSGNPEFGWIAQELLATAWINHFTVLRSSLRSRLLEFFSSIILFGGLNKSTKWRKVQKVNFFNRRWIPFVKNPGINEKKYIFDKKL
jgi:hypothetical protein